MFYNEGADICYPMLENKYTSEIRDNAEQKEAKAKMYIFASNMMNYRKQIHLYIDMIKNEEMIQGIYFLVRRILINEQNKQDEEENRINLHRQVFGGEKTTQSEQLK